MRSVPHLILLTALIAAGGNAQQSRSVTVQILAINDFHANLEPPSGSNGMVNGTPAGGIEYLATHIRAAMRENPNSLLVGAGDLMGASPLLSMLLHDTPAIEALNALNLSVTSIGNHEFDHGVDDLLRRLHGGCLQPEPCRDGETSPPAKFEYLAANVIKTSDGKTLFPATAVRTLGGVKIGFIGETLEGTPAITSAKATSGLRFLEESGVANSAAAELERQGVHAVVLLIHEGGSQRADNGRADPNGCENMNGEIVGIAKKLAPSIKVVVSAHSHQFYNCEIAGHRVTSASSYGRMFTRINLTIDTATDTITSLNAVNETVTRDVQKDPVESAILAKYAPRVAAIANRPVGSITAPITTALSPTGESSMGEVVADAHLASAAAPDTSAAAPGKGGAVIGFINEGGIRASLTGTLRPDGARDVTFNDLYNVQPFGNRVMVVTMTGDMIRRLLEQQFSAQGRRKILQVSQGFSYQYRLNAPLGQHVVPKSIMLNGKPIGPADRVRVEALDFLMNGGDGFTVFKEGTDATAGPMDVDALADYFAAHSPVAPSPRNRITRLD